MRKGRLGKAKFGCSRTFYTIPTCKDQAEKIPLGEIVKGLQLNLVTY